VKPLIGLLMLLGSLSWSQKLVKVDGSSTVFPLTEAVAEEFQMAHKGLRVTVGISGTGGGFKKFCRGETDVQNASRPIQASEMKACAAKGIRFIELPVAFDAIAIVVHPSNAFAQDITVEELKKIWEPSAQGKIKKWSDVRKSWPETPLVLFGAGSDSGTFDYFTEAIVGKAKSSRGDYTASEDDNTLVMGVSREKGALGYLPIHYFEENHSKLKALNVIYKGKTQIPSTATVIKGEYAPLARPLLIYVSEKGLERDEVKKFTEFYIQNSLSLAQEIKAIPLPATAYTGVLGHLQKRIWGTAYEGHSQVGMKIEDLLKKSKN
jgi:phosphate transport system substrate-binding protein